MDIIYLMLFIALYINKQNCVTQELKEPQQASELQSKHSISNFHYCCKSDVIVALYKTTKKLIEFQYYCTSNTFLLFIIYF